jgi:tetratricopeptide (TPR) repeat protein
MANYQVIENMTQNKELEMLLRSSISNWARNFRDEYADFGNQITIDKITYLPTHAAAFQGYYEHRKAEYAERPLSAGEKINGKPTITSPSAVNPWDYELEPLPDTWEEQNNSILLSDSKRIEKCPNCDGHGNNRCYDCKGQGVQRCKICQGKGTISCSTCHGKGTLTCKVCSGRKYTESRDMYGNIVRKGCSSCGGTGEIRCYTCSGKGKWDCKDCKGKGEVECATCRGEGVLECRTCQGQGKMLKYIRVVQRYLPHTIIRYYNHREVDRCFPGFKFDTSTPGDVLAEYQAERLDDGYLDNIFNAEGLKHKDFRQDLEKTRQRLDVECPVGTLGKNTISRRQMFMLIQAAVYFVEYRYKGKEFSLLVWGSKTEFVHAENSPFHHERYDYFSKGREHFDNKRYGKAMECFEEALRLNQDEEVKHTLEETIQWIIGVLPKQYLKGIRHGGLLVIVLFCFFIFALPNSVDLITPGRIIAFYEKQSILWVYVGSTLVGLSALLTLILTRRRIKIYKNPNRKIIKSDKLRYTIGLTNGLTMAILSIATVLALNYYGVLASVIRVVKMAADVMLSFIGT